MSKYEVAPGLFIGSEIGDIDRETKKLIGEYLRGNELVFPRIRALQDRRRELLMPRKFQRAKDRLR